MKRTLILFSSILFTFSAMAQIKDPVKWSFSATKKSDKVYELTFTAEVEKPWHIYSQHTPKGGPVPTKFVYKVNPLIKADASVNESSNIKTIHEEVFGVDVKYFEGKAVFTQIVNLKSAAKTNIAGTIEYMACNNTTCMPPKKVPFDITLQ
ncbi:MAG TPA: protein-disulfide reductase DsbD family protein [Panacibacter sp.]|nr:protein-disulfide reductase DsbD family protein [Panacibacter sp.]HNP45174.1 protein-disulfide reductase DsbD family protein [Panacibacter sp.]